MLLVKKEKLHIFPQFSKKLLGKTIMESRYIFVDGDLATACEQIGKNTGSVGLKGPIKMQILSFVFFY